MTYMDKKLTLKEAREQGKLDEFIKQQKGQKPVDKDRFDRLVADAETGKIKTEKTYRKRGKKGSSGD